MNAGWLVLKGGVVVRTAMGDQIYSFTPTGGAEMLIYVPHLETLRAQSPEHWKTITTPIVLSDAATLVRRHGIDVHALDRITAGRLDEPGWGLFLDNGTFLVADGIRRYVARATAGPRWMRFYTCRAPHWHAALIDMPATLRRQQP